MKNLFQYHFTFAATGTDSGINAGDTCKEILPGFFFMLLVINAEEFLAQSQFSLAISVAQDPIVPDLHEAIRENMEKKAADKLESIQGHRLQGIVIVAVAISEGDLIFLHPDESIIGDGHSVSVSPKIIHYGLSAGKGRFAVHDPLLVIEIIEHCLEGVILFQMGDVSGKNQLSFFFCLLEIGKELSPK